MASLPTLTRALSTTLLLLTAIACGPDDDYAVQGAAGSGGQAAGAAGGAGEGGAAGEAAGMSGSSGQSGAAGQGGAAGAGGEAGQGGAAGEAGAGGEGACRVCEAYADEVVNAGKVGAKELTELSGLAASRQRAGVLYAHNDSGDVARVFAVSLAGEALGEYAVDGAKAVDWEDIAAGPCPAGQCVFVADIGDNSEKRDDLVIYRIDEAALVGSASGHVAAEALPIAYPDGPHNAETLLVDSETGDLLIVTKTETEAAGVYRLAAGAATVGATATLERVATVTLPAGANPLITGGDAHPCAPRLLLRTYVQLYEYRAPAGGALLDALASPPVALAVSKELQGEAAAYLADGSGYVTASEGLQPMLHRTDCP